MKKKIFAFAVLALLATTAFAQDDMYFIPKKAEKADVPKLAPVRGLDMSVDEYNRKSRGSSYQIIGKDSLGNDIIEFSKVDSVDFQPEDREFYYTSRMGMFDDYYGWYSPWFYNYRGLYWGHYYPYYYSSFYDPWGLSWWGYYDPFYDPFYFSGYYGWYGYNSWYWWNPWAYYGYWYRPYYWYGGGISYRYANSGELAHRSNRPAVSNYSRGYTSAPHGNFGGRTVAERTYRGGGSTASNRTAYTRSNSQTGGLRRSGGGSRTSSYSYSPSRSFPSSTPSTSSSSWSSSSSSSRSSGGLFSAGGGSRGGGGGGGGGSFGGGGSRSGGSFSGGGRGR